LNWKKSQSGERRRVEIESVGIIIIIISLNGNLQQAKNPHHPSFIRLFSRSARRRRRYTRSLSL
jgi:hypothetical protein